MARKSLWLALGLFTLAIGPALLSVDAQQCPWSMKMKMQQQSTFAYKQQMQQQQMMQMKMQQQIQQFKQTPRVVQVPRQMPVMQPRYTPRPPVMAYKPPQIRQYQPPTVAINKMKIVQQQNTQKMMQTKILQQKLVQQRTTQTRRPTGPGVGMPNMNRTRVNTQIVQKQVLMQKQMMVQRQKLVMSRTSYKPPPIRTMIPAKRNIRTQPPRIARQIPPQLQQKKLILPEPVRRQQELKAQLELKKQMQMVAKKTKIETKTTTVKMDMSCVNCHKKMKINLDNPLPGKQQGPGMLPMIAQKPRPGNPLQMAIAPPRLPVIIDCGPAPKFNQPIAGAPQRFPMGMGGPQGNPFNMPIGMMDPTPRNPWMDGSSKLMAGVTAPGTRKPGQAQVSSLQNPLSPKKDVGMSPDGKRTASKDPQPDWKTPAMPPMAQGQSRSDLFLLNPIETAPARPSREVSDTKTAKESASRDAVALPTSDLDGPTLPALPRSARVIHSVSPWEGTTKDDDWYSPQVVLQSVRTARPEPDADPARPPLPPLASRVLLPR